MREETILCIGTADWNSLWRPIHQIMSRIARQNRVFYFEPGRNSDRDVFSELWRKIPYFFICRPKQLHDNFILIPTPYWLPYARKHLPGSVLRITTPLVAKFNAHFLARQISRVVIGYQIKSPILWLFEPRHIDLLGKFGEKLVCYFNYDEYPDFVENKRMRDVMRDYDNQLTSQSDVVFATGKAQWERRKKINPNSFFIPNAADFDLFHKALEEETEIPEDISKIKKPIIGYAGWLGNQMDIPLLLRIADVFPDCSLVLVGPENIPMSGNLLEIRGKSNVHFLGRKDLNSLPAYLKAIDVALIPYLLEGYTLTAYPLKLHEYLAAGRAVVATSLPELRPFSHVVRIAETHAEFIRQISEALEDHAPQAIAARVAIARENTWDNRVAEIYRILQNQLSGVEAMAP